jgi:uncharacterized protein YbjT (DUF2867 family)
MAKPILVTGGTGTLGQHVFPRLLEAGRDVRVLSRLDREKEGDIEFATGDLATGEGIEAAVDGTEIIVHLGGSAKGDEVKAQHLVDAASKAGVRHLVYISVVGADKIPVEGRFDRAMFGYFRSKYEAEQIIAESGVPWTTLRATQFHDLVLKTAQALVKLPVVPVFSGLRFQPIDSREVADRLVELALAAPAGLVPAIAGPWVYDLTDLVRMYLQASGKHRLILPIRLPGNAARAIQDGATLAPDHAVGRRTWEDFLAEQVSAPREIGPITA